MVSICILRSFFKLGLSSSDGGMKSVQCEAFSIMYTTLSWPPCRGGVIAAACQGSYSPLVYSTREFSMSKPPFRSLVSAIVAYTSRSLIPNTSRQKAREKSAVSSREKG